MNKPKIMFEELKYYIDNIPKDEWKYIRIRHSKFYLGIYSIEFELDIKSKTLKDRYKIIDKVFETASLIDFLEICNKIPKIPRKRKPIDIALYITKNQNITDKAGPEVQSLSTKGQTDDIAYYWYDRYTLSKKT